jgi:hypothetical protein
MQVRYFAPCSLPVSSDGCHRAVIHVYVEITCDISSRISRTAVDKLCSGCRPSSLWLGYKQLLPSPILRPLEIEVSLEPNAMDYILE